jgi:hypothetical protein
MRMLPTVAGAFHGATFKYLSLDQKKCVLSAITSYQQGRPISKVAR